MPGTFIKEQENKGLLVINAQENSICRSIYQDIYIYHPDIQPRI